MLKNLVCKDKSRSGCGRLYRPARACIGAGSLSTAIILLLTACIFSNSSIEYVAGGDPRRGEVALRDYGCGACHTIPGIPGANTTVGPSLTNWAERAYIAGSLSNTPENLLRWLQAPQEIEPGSVMPDLDVSEQAARDISAYLYTLRGE
jgi:cytochrome c2